VHARERGQHLWVGWSALKCKCRAVSIRTIEFVGGFDKGSLKVRGVPEVRRQNLDEAMVMLSHDDHR
jgi:hypothetical protein